MNSQKTRKRKEKVKKVKLRKVEKMKRRAEMQRVMEIIRQQRIDAEMRRAEALLQIDKFGIPLSLGWKKEGF